MQITKTKRKINIKLAKLIDNSLQILKIDRKLITTMKNAEQIVYCNTDLYQY